MAVGVFGLQVAYKLKRTELLSLEDTHGWFGGGFAPAVPATVSIVERIDFSNDSATASPRGPLSVARRTAAATGNSNYGWFGGGWFSPSTPQINYSTVDRIDFSNDSATALARGPLASTRYSIASTGNSNYGWFGGGQLFDPVTPLNTAKSSVDRIDFSNDSATASPRGPLSLARYGSAATGNSNYGWFGGGVDPTPAYYSTVDRIDFSNDSGTATVRGSLTVGKYRLQATGNSNYGWFAGGLTMPSILSTVDRIDFSNDSGTASPRGPLIGNRAEGGGTGNSNYGWIGGTSSTIVDRIDFSNDLRTTSLRGPLSLTRYDVRATSGQAKSSSIRLQKAGNFGWIGGNGYYVPPFSKSVFSTVDRIDFSNDSVTALPRGLLSIAKDSLAATGNSNYGWFGGGSPGPVSTVDRIDFSNDSVTASIRGPIRQRNSHSSVGNSNYGWFGAGGALSTVDRIDFSNDISLSSARGNLSINTNQLAATGNSNYGWFAGGQAPGPPYIGYSYLQRIEFSNDLSTAPLRGLLSASGYMCSATGNSNYGWVGSRTRDGGATAITTIDRINFSNDSVTASPRGLLNIGRRSASATGNSNYGWWFGGILNPGQLSAYSSVERINFSNDSVTASLRGSLTGIRSTSTATSNTPIG